MKPYLTPIPLVAVLSAALLAGILPSAHAADSNSSADQKLLEWRTYHLNSPAQKELLDDYLATALIPALNRMGCKPVGAFTELDVEQPTEVYLLIPYDTAQDFAEVKKRLMTDQKYLEAGRDYLNVPKEEAAFERIESVLLLAFKGMPHVHASPYGKGSDPRIFELRNYESYSEKKGQKKVEMFNNGEIEVMQELGMGPIFYGQAMVGPDMPNLVYMLSAKDRESHREHWQKFGSHPVWQELKNDPQYADTVSHISNQFLKPTEYSQL